MEEKTTEKAHEINSSGNKKVRDRGKPILLVIVVISIFIVANLLGLGEKLGDMQNWIQSLGPWGPVAFIMIYIMQMHIENDIIRHFSFKDFEKTPT